MLPSVYFNEEAFMHCPKCGVTERVKNGIANGLQRWHCKGCGCNYTKSSQRGIPLETKKRAISLYLEGLGFRSISRFLGVSHVSLQRWVRDLSRQIINIKAAQLEERCHARIMELDEMWHFVGKKTTSSGCGWLLIEIPAVSVRSGLVAVVERH